jgi:hypothetical protein
VVDDRKRLFPGSYFYPLYLQLLVTIEVSNNRQDFTYSGINFLYQADAVIDSILPNSGLVGESTAIIVAGSGFVNSTSLKCRIGEFVTTPTFLSSSLVLCFTPKVPLKKPLYGYDQHRKLATLNTPQERLVQTSIAGDQPNVVLVEVSNNGFDFTNNQHSYSFNISCGTGFYCPQLVAIPSPPGTFSSGDFNFNFTLCPAGTYNPLPQQSSCFRCPIGFICPEEGMQVPRICPAGSVCEFTGMMKADNPCPQGEIFICL